jgi:serine phosphatase RsbU (regulator of sigma subunit)
MQQAEHELELAAAEQRAEAERLRQELDWARQIQQRLFPSAGICLPGFDIAGSAFPADATGGDYFDYIPMIDNSLGLVIGDVSGHGVGPALLMATTRAYLHALAESGNDVGRMLTLANRALVTDVGDDGFVTLLVARMNPRKRTLVYSSAGHPPGYVLRASGEVKAVLESGGMPLGIMDRHYLAAPKVSLGPGDLVVMFTDGLVETRARDDAPFKTERVLSVIRENQERPARDIVAALYDAARTFADEQPQQDDITAIVVKVAA